MLKQKQFSPLPFSKQILIIYAGTNGFLDDLAVDQVRDFEAELYKFVDTTNPGLLRSIMEKKILDDNLKAEMTKVIKQCKETFVAQKQGLRSSSWLFAIASSQLGGCQCRQSPVMTRMT